jgi:hypothetical protein
LTLADINLFLSFMPTGLLRRLSLLSFGARESEVRIGRPSAAEAGGEPPGCKIFIEDYKHE